MIIHVLGHFDTCPKCRLMRDRVSRLLHNNKMYGEAFTLQSHDHDRHDDSDEDRKRAEADIVQFCLTGNTNNNQNVPCLCISNDNGDYIPRNEGFARLIGANAHPSVFGLQTNYNEAEGGNGTVSVEQITKCLDYAAKLMRGEI